MLIKKKVFQNLTEIINILKVPYNDLKLKQPLAIHNRIIMWLKGFYSDKYLAYVLSNNNSREYLSDYHEIKARTINKPYAEILNNKILFRTIISDYLNTPIIFGVIEKGLLYFYDVKSQPSFFHKHNSPIEASIIVEDLCRDKGKIVLKEISGALGKGYMRIDFLEPGLLAVNRKKIKTADFQLKLNLLSGYMLTEFVEQSVQSNCLFPHTTNVIRLLTMIDPADGKAFIPAAVKKSGTEASAPSDNSHYGALAANINLETGELSAATQYNKNGLNWHTHHPDTGALIEGVRIPIWPLISKEIINAAEKISYIKYIGWDIVDQDQSFSVLEGNNHPQMKVVQAHKPLLRDKRVAEFYKYHKVL